MWHGPFRAADMCGDLAVKLNIAGTPFRLFPIVNLSNLKKVKTFPERPKDQLTMDEAKITWILMKLCYQKTVGKAILRRGNMK